MSEIQERVKAIIVDKLGVEDESSQQFREEATSVLQISIESEKSKITAQSQRSSRSRVLITLLLCL